MLNLQAKGILDNLSMAIDTPLKRMKFQAWSAHCFECGEKVIVDSELREDRWCQSGMCYECESEAAANRPDNVPVLLDRILIVLGEIGKTLTEIKTKLEENHGNYR